MSHPVGRHSLISAVFQTSKKHSSNKEGTESPCHRSSSLRGLLDRGLLPWHVARQRKQVAIMGSSEPLGLLSRWYIYAIHGYVCEVLFTAVLDFAASGDWRFQGVTSVWALFIYGTAMLGVEHMYLTLRNRWGTMSRCLLYTLWVYLCELSSGCILTSLGACPWDYSHYRYNYRGLVTMEYAPFWFMGCVILEKMLIWHTLRLRLDGTWEPQEEGLKRD
ncbi:transmembrane protein 229B-like [Rhinophrynus dorsalis]